MTRVLSLLMVGLCLAAPAGAQPLESGSGRDHWFSMGGGGVVAVVPWEGFIDLWPTVLARVNVSSRLAAELNVEFSSFRRLNGIYQLQQHYAPGPLGRKVTPFLTVGVLGEFQSRRVRERRQTFPTGDVVIYPAYRFSRVSAPFGVLGGGGARIRMTPRVSIETGGRLILGQGTGFLQFDGTVVVPIGPRKARR